MCESRSAVLLRAFTRFASFFTTPEITLKYVTRPENGSATVLNTNADTGSESFTVRSFSELFSVPFHGPRSAGFGKFSRMKFKARSVAVLFNPEAHNTGKIRI